MGRINRRKIIDLSMTFMLVLIGIIILKFTQKIIGWLFVLVGAMASYKEFLELIQFIYESVKQTFGGSNQHQNVEDSTNVIQTGDAGRDINIIQTPVKLEKRNKHFEELKNGVIKPWHEDLFEGLSIFDNDDGICEIKICESHRIKKVLFKDLKNHFPKLIRDYDKLKQKYKKHKIECKNFSNDLLKKINTNAKHTVWLSKLIYYKLTSKSTSDMEPHIQEDRLLGGGYTYAEGNEHSLNEILLNLKMIVESKTLKRRAKQISKNEFILKKQAEKFSENLQKTIHLQTLDGSCEFLE